MSEISKNMQVSIEGNVAKVTINDGRGGVTSKNISVTSLCQMLANSNTTLTTIVPPGCRMLVNKRNCIYALFVFPAHVGRYYISWGEGDRQELGVPETFTKSDIEDTSRHSEVYELDLPYPHLAFLVKVISRGAGKGYEFGNMWAFALKDINRPLEQLEAYQWPLTNVYEDYHCCIGNIAHNYISIESISSIPRTFFNGINNRDLDWNANFIREPKDASYGRLTSGYQMIAKIAGKSKFPYEYLKPIGNLVVQVNSIIG